MAERPRRRRYADKRMGGPIDDVELAARGRRTGRSQRRRVAAELGSRPERLLMVDYQQRASADDSLPTLSDVFSAFGSWKRARREAAL